jgi:dystonin
LSTAKKVLRESSQSDDTSMIREKAEDLKEAMDTVTGLSSDRLSCLEQALPLAEHFHETHAGLSAWMDDMEQQARMLQLPALRPDLIAQQQDRNEVKTFFLYFVCLKVLTKMLISIEEKIGCSPVKLLF